MRERLDIGVDPNAEDDNHIELIFIASVERKLYLALSYDIVHNKVVSILFLSLKPHFFQVAIDSILSIEH